MRLNAGAAFKLIGALLAVLVLLPPSANAQSAATKIGYVDLKRLLDDAPQMVESRAKLEHEFAPRDDALKADEAKLAALKQRYDRDSAIMKSMPIAAELPRRTRIVTYATAACFLALLVCGPLIEASLSERLFSTALLFTSVVLTAFMATSLWSTRNGSTATVTD